MNTLNYVIEANIGIAILYAAYKLLLAAETDFTVQRGFMLAGLIVCLFVPLIDVNPALMAADLPSLSKVLPEIVVTGQRPPSAASNEYQGILQIPLLIYIAGIVFLAVPIIIQAVKLYRLVQNSTAERHGNSLVVKSLSNSTFSFFNVIILGRSGNLTDEERKLVILHEQRHGELMHSLDVILVTLVTIAFWFNPFVWMYRRSLIRVHEYQADQFVSQVGTPADYSALLAKTTLAGNGLLFTHQFNQSFILKRIQMIHQLKRKVGSWKLLSLAIVIVGYSVTVSCVDQVSHSETAFGPNAADIPAEVSNRLIDLRNANPFGEYEAIMLKGLDLKSIPLKDGQSLEYLFHSEGPAWAIINKSGRQGDVLTIADESASPIGGMRAFFEHVAHALVYPTEARQMGIEGQVLVEFVVQTDGRLSDFKVLKGLGSQCDASALRAVMDAPAWKPATQSGVVVAQRIVLPITFKLG